MSNEIDRSIGQAGLAPDLSFAQPISSLHTWQLEILRLSGINPHTKANSERETIQINHHVHWYNPTFGFNLIHLIKKKSRWWSTAGELTNESADLWGFFFANLSLIIPAARLWLLPFFLFLPMIEVRCNFCYSTACNFLVLKVSKLLWNSACSLLTMCFLWCLHKDFVLSLI